MPVKSPLPAAGERVHATGVTVTSSHPLHERVLFVSFALFKACYIPPLIELFNGGWGGVGWLVYAGSGVIIKEE